MNDKDMPEIITGGNYTDNRGTLTYFNDFNLIPVKRLYILEHPDTCVIRAWQGHQHENKWFHVVAGSFKFILVRPDNWNSPSPSLSCQEFVLCARDNQVFHVPGGYATGFKAVEQDSKMLVFSNFSVEESLNDDFRFDKDKWYNWY